METPETSSYLIPQGKTPLLRQVLLLQLAAALFRQEDTIEAMNRVVALSALGLFHGITSTAQDTDTINKIRAAVDAQEHEAAAEHCEQWLSDLTNRSDPVQQRQYAASVVSSFLAFRHQNIWLRFLPDRGWLLYSVKDWISLAHASDSAIDALSALSDNDLFPDAVLPVIAQMDRKGPGHGYNLPLHLPL